MSVGACTTFNGLATEEGSSSGGSSGKVKVTDDGGAIVSTCANDSECTGGKKCKEVGTNQKACVINQSCTGGPGASKTCGAAADETTPGAEDCCKTLAVPGGSYNQFNDAKYPAKVSPYILDAFEVTGGRFRAWVEATNGNLRGSAPKAGAGAHPRVANSGWRAEWNDLLPASRTEVDQMLGPEQCQVGGNLDQFGTLTWWTNALEQKIKQTNGGKADIMAANSKEALDEKPLNCVPWHVLMAFCIWDGGRLPTNAEWGFAAAGGSEQRDFAWGSVPDKDLVFIGGRNDLSKVPIFDAGQKYVVASLYDPTQGPNNDLDPKVYVHTWGGKFRVPRDNALHVSPVGRRAAGNGRWGHANLADGMIEWMLDSGPILPGECNDCANVNFVAYDQFDPKAKETIPDFEHRWYQGGARAARGSAWDNSIGMANHQTALEIEGYTSYPLRRTYRSLGGRCARDF